MIAITDTFPRRPLLVIVMAAAIWGSLTSFQNFRASLPKPEAIDNKRDDAQAEYSIVITLTFDAEGDAFSPMAMRVSLDGVTEPIFESDTTLPAGVPVLISPVAGIKVGVNELLIEVGSGTDSTEATQQHVAHAIRVQVMADAIVIAERTLWSEPGNAISGLIVIDVPENRAANAAAMEDEEHQH